MRLYMQFRIILVFSNHILHTVYYTSGSKTFFGLQSTCNFCTVHYTMKTLFVMPSTEMCSVKSVMPCYTMDTAMCKGLRENVLLRIFHLKPPISVHLEKDAIEGFRGGTRRTSWRNITVPREKLWGQICDIMSPKQNILNVDITSRDFRLLLISR